MKICAKLENDECKLNDTGYGKCANKVKENYLDIYEGIQSELDYLAKFDKTTGIAITYIGKKNIDRKDNFKAEESFPLRKQGMNLGKLLDGTDVHILLETGVSKFFMSKRYYLRNKLLHDLPKFSSMIRNVQAGNGQFYNVLTILSVILRIHGHIFEIYIQVSETHD